MQPAWPRSLRTQAPGSPRPIRLHRIRQEGKHLDKGHLALGGPLAPRGLQGLGRFQQFPNLTHKERGREVKWPTQGHTAAISGPWTALPRTGLGMGRQVEVACMPGPVLDPTMRVPY